MGLSYWISIHQSIQSKEFDVFYIIDQILKSCCCQINAFVITVIGCISRAVVSLSCNIESSSCHIIEAAADTYCGSTHLAAVTQTHTPGSVSAVLYQWMGVVTGGRRSNCRYQMNHVINPICVITTFYYDTFTSNIWPSSSSFLVFLSREPL